MIIRPLEVGVLSLPFLIAHELYLTKSLDELKMIINFKTMSNTVEVMLEAVKSLAKDYAHQVIHCIFVFN